MDRNSILPALRKFRSLFSYVTSSPDKLLRELAAIIPSRHMVFPCDVIDLRIFLSKEKITSTNPLPLFSLTFAEKHLKDYSIFLVLDAQAVQVENYKYGGIQLNNTESLDISKLLLRIIVNEPAAEGAFNYVKQIVEELGVGVECLVSNSIPGISTPSHKLSITSRKYKFSQTTEITLSPVEEKIFNHLRQITGGQVQMRVAGGWVRDKLLGKESDDIDIAVDMPGYELAMKISPDAYKVSLEKSADPAEITPSDDLMVGAVNLFGQKIEFVPMRTEHYPDANSRQPSIKLTNNPEEDVKRRDLTINAIYYNINTGKIEDYVGGRNDLGLDGSGQIHLRTPDDPFKTFHEDPLRLLRVLRFHARYPNSVVDPSIIEAMKDPSIQESYTKKVATERAGPEIMKMLAAEDPVDSLKLLFETGLYKTVFKVPLMDTINEQGIQMEQQTPWHKYNLLQHTLEVVKNLNQIMKDKGESDYMRGLMNVAALFHDFGKMQGGIQQSHPKNEGQMQYIGHEHESVRMANQILKSIGVGKDDRDIVNQVIRLHMRPHDADKWGPKGSGKFLRQTRMHGKDEEHKDLWKYIFYHAQADQMSSQPDKFDPEENQRVFDKFQNFVESPTGSFKGTVLNGNDIIALFPQLRPATGYIKEVLDYVKELQDTNQIDVSGDINAAKQQATMMVQQIAPQIIDKYKESSMGGNWFKKAQSPPVAEQRSVPQDYDPEIKKGPKKALPRYYTGMRIRDRRKGVANPQEGGVVDSIRGNQIKIIWSPDNKEKKKEEVFDMVENTEILSLIVAEE